MSWLELAVIAFIIIGITVAVWKGGSANPEGTGSLGRKVNDLAGDVKSLGGRVRHVEDEVKGMKEKMATDKDVARIEERINTVRAEIEGHRALSQATNDSVRRIERVLIEKSLDK